MKNKFIALALVTLSIATTTVSCTKNEDPTTPAKAMVTEKASVSVDFTAQGQNSKTAKTVNGGLYAWINEIDVVTKSNDFNYAPFMTPFYMTTAPIGSTDAYGNLVVGNYTLENVALGSNDFTVTTKCNTPQLFTLTTTTLSATDAMTAAKGKNPYAVYGASLLGKTVVKGANTLPSTMLTTTNGRAVAVFTLSSALNTLGVTAKITVNPSVPMPQSLPAITLNSTTNGQFYWSNTTSTDGTNAVYTVQLLDKNGNVFNTFTATMNLTASTSTNTIYTINESDITTNTDMDMFTAQPWVNNDPTNGTIGN